MPKILSLIHFIFLISILVSCSRRQEQSDVVIIAIEGDVDSFNPLFAEDVIAGEINDLLYPALVGSDFDSESGELIYTPLLARSWASDASGHDLTFHLVSDARWSDDIPITAKDVQLSYKLYGDTEVASVRQAAVGHKSGYCRRKQYHNSSSR
jgi:peptide/nickel transport system substrate-binding protein